jgi:hypothetical protein
LMTFVNGSPLPPATLVKEPTNVPLAALAA